MTFPIKKRINTKLRIDKNKGLYTHKNSSGKIEEFKMLWREKKIGGNENKHW